MKKVIMDKDLYHFKACQFSRGMKKIGYVSIQYRIKFQPPFILC